MNQSLQRSQHATPLLVFVGIVALSVVFFFVFTLPQCGGSRGTSVAATGTMPAATPPAAKPPATNPAPVVPPVAPVTPPAPAKSFYLKSSQFLNAVAERLAAGKVAETLELLAPGIPQERTELYQKLFTSGWRPVMASNPWKEIGRMGGQERWALPLELPAAVVQSTPGDQSAPPSPTPAAPLPEIEVDLKLSREEGYQITNIRFSPELLKASNTATTAALLDPPDPLSISHEFVSEVLGKNFRRARLITDGTKVTHEKLAGLCIVFEEGEYVMVPGSSLNVTAANSERAWALVRVKSPKQNTESEFGVELAKDAKNQWKVDSLDFSRLLQSYVQATEGGKVYYTPIVKSPSGGESLVVYFEYDKSELTERGLRQMEIVADLLKSDPARKMRLSGYADALGTEDYNYILSKKRADAVQAKLKELGVNPAQIVARGFGTQAPLDPNTKDDGSDNPEGRSRNRRTEIYLDF